jgi:aryl-alcohol dehydrogenase-like predicted oxidoreductase
MNAGPASPLSDVRPRLGLGTAGFKPDRRDASLAVLDEWAALGGTLIDTAAVYGGGESERVVGEWLRGSGAGREVVLLTKGAHPDMDTWEGRLDPASIAADLAQSLERLGVDSVDIYLVHRDDAAVPVGEIIDALNEHVAAGTVRSIGASNWTPSRVDEANAYAAEHGLTGFTLLSNYFGLAHPAAILWPGTLSSTGQEERAWHARTRMPLLAWSSQSQGWFSDDLDLPALGADYASVYDTPLNRARRERAFELARERDVSAAQIALAWVLNQPIAPYALVGARTPEGLRAAWAASEILLADRELAWLETGGS